MGAGVESVQRLKGSAPGAGGIAGADPSGEGGQRLVDLVLDERGAGGGRAEGRSAAVDDEDSVAVAREHFGDQRPGDAGTDDEHVGRLALGRVRPSRVAGGVARCQKGRPERRSRRTVVNAGHRRDRSSSGFSGLDLERDLG